MAQTIKLKRSAVSGNTPSTSDLALGEIAINTHDGKVFIKKDDGSASIIEVGAADNSKLPLTGGTLTGTLQGTRLGLGVAPHATASLNITTTNQHIRLNNGSELGVISLLSGGELDIWGHGDNETINFRTGSGSGTVALAITGTNSVFSGNLSLGDNVKAQFGAGNDLEIYHDGSNSIINDAGTGGLDIRSNELKISTHEGETMAVFSSNADVSLRYNNSTKLATTSGGVTVTGGVTADSLSIDSLSMNGTSIGSSGNMTLDVAGDIILDADGADVIFADGGTQYGFIGNSSSDMVIKPMVQDKDLIIKGNDGGSTITALTLDMSDAGSATFNSNIKLFDSKQAQFGNSNNGTIHHDGSHFRLRSGTGNFNIQTDDFHITDSSNTTLRFRVDADGATDIRYNGSTKLVTTNTGVEVTGSLTTSANLTVSGNLEVTGTTTQTGSIITNSNFTGLSDANSANSTDFGFYGKYVESSTTKYAGVYYDASVDNTFKFFCDTQTAPTTTVNESATGYALANVQVAGLTVGSGTINSSTDVALSRDGSTSNRIRISNGNIHHDTNTIISGNLEISGNFNIAGDINQTSVTTLDVTDKTITVANNAGSAANANDAGLIVDTGGTNPSLLYKSSGDKFVFNKPLDAGNGTFSNLTIGATEKLRFDGSGGHTFIQESSNDTLTFATGGSTRLTLDSNATFSGTISANSGTTNTVATFTSTDAGAGINLTDNSGTSTLQTNGANLRIGVDEDGAVASSAIQFRVDGSTKATLNSSGNLGIGTTAPAGKLHVDGLTSSVATIFEGNGNGDTAPLLFRVKANNNSVSNMGVFGNAGSTSADNTIHIGPSNTSGITVNQSGNATFSGSVSATSADLRNTSSGAETTALSLRNYAAGANTATALNFYPTQSTTRFASIVAENVDGNNNIALSFLTSAGDTPTAALTLNQDRSATFSSSVRSTALISGSLLNPANNSLTILGGGSATNNGANLTMYGSAAAASAGEFRFRNGTSEKMRLDSSGQLGIGTSAPASLLNLAHATAPTFRLSRTGTGQQWIQSIDSSGRLLFLEAASTGGTLFTRMSIDDTGEVGIGVTPASGIQLQLGNAANSSAITRVTNGTVHVDLTASSSGKAFLEVGTNHPLVLATNATERMRISNTGQVGIGTTAPTANLHVKSTGNGEIEVERASGALINLQAQSAAGYIGTDSNHLFGLKANGTVRLKIATSGAISFNDEYTFPTADGSANQVLKTDGSGNLTFASISGAGAVTSISDADGDTKIQVEESSDEDKIRFDTAGSERMIIDNAGKVGIGTTAPANQLVVKSGTGVDMEFGSESTAAFIQTYNRTSSAYGHLRFVTNGETMRLTNTGNVGIGTTAPSYKLALKDNSASAYPLSLESGTIGTAGNHIGIRFGFTGNTYQKGAIIYEAANDGGYGRGKFMFALEGTADASNADETDAKMTIDYSGNVGIGTTAPAHKLHIASGTTNVGIQTVSTDAGAYMGFEDNTTGNTGSNSNVFVGANGNNFVIHTGATEKVRVDSSGSVGIGTSSPSPQVPLTAVYSNTSQFHFGGAQAGISNNTYYNGSAWVNRNASVGGSIFQMNTSGEFHFRRAGTGANPTVSYSMTITSGGDLLVGKTASSVSTDGVELLSSGFTRATVNGDTVLQLNRRNSDGTIINFRKDGSTVGSIASLSGDILIGTGNTGLRFYDAGKAIQPRNTDGSTARGSDAISLGMSDDPFKDLYLSGTANANAINIKSGSTIHGTITTSSSSLTLNARNTGILLFQSGGAEKMRLSGGNLIVGKTATTFATQGAVINHNGTIDATRSGDAPLYLNRLASDGNIASFYKASVAVGNIAVQDADNLYISGSATNHAGLKFGTQTLIPMVESAQSDNTVNLGTTSARFHDAHFGGTVNVGENLVVTGNLTINGTTTTLNTATLNVEDKNITLNYGAGDTTSTADGAGITIQDAVNSSTDATILWDASNDRFNYSHGISLPDNQIAFFGTGSDGRIKFDGTDTLEITASNGTGDHIKLKSNNISLQQANGNNYLTSSAGSATTLYYANAAKIATASGGASVTGALSVSGNLSTGFFEIGDDSTTTTATTQVAIAAFAASSVRSCKLLVQVTNTTDSTYHFTEVSIIHDGTDTYMTEYGSMFTGSAAEATFTSDISSGSVRLLATPASTDSMTFKVVRQMITV